MNQTLIDLETTSVTNMAHIDKFIKFADLLEKTEDLISTNLERNLTEINELNIMFKENLELFRIIKNNLGISS